MEIQPVITPLCFQSSKSDTAYLTCGRVLTGVDINGVVERFCRLLSLCIPRQYLPPYRYHGYEHGNIHHIVVLYGRGLRHIIGNLQAGG